MSTKEETSCVTIQRWWRNQYITIECPVCYLTNEIPNTVPDPWNIVGQGRFITPYTCQHYICHNCFDLWRQRQQGHSCPCCRCPENMVWDEYNTPNIYDDIIPNTPNTDDPHPELVDEQTIIVGDDYTEIIYNNENLNFVDNENPPLPELVDEQNIIGNYDNENFNNFLENHTNHIANTLIFPDVLNLNDIVNMLIIFMNNTNFNADERINRIVLEMFIHNNYNLIYNALGNYNNIIIPTNNDRLNITSVILNGFREFLIMNNDINVLLNLLNTSNNNIIDYVYQNTNINILNLINYVRNSLLNNNNLDNVLIMVG